MLKREQIKVLNAELREAGSWISSHQIAMRRHPMTPAVRRAKRVVERHDAMIRRERAKLDRRYEGLKKKARHAIYFGTERQATAAIKDVIKFYLAHSS